jgi:hypothetical protein
LVPGVWIALLRGDPSPRTPAARGVLARDFFVTSGIPARA